jgi:hypothetical protein
LNVAVRRLFIKKFLTADAIRLNGVRYNPAALIEADRDMASYLAWVARVAKGGGANPPGDSLDVSDATPLRANEDRAGGKSPDS